MTFWACLPDCPNCHRKQVVSTFLSNTYRAHSAPRRGHFASAHAVNAQQHISAFSEFPSVISFNTLCKNNPETGLVILAPTQEPTLSFLCIPALCKSHTVPIKNCAQCYLALPRLPARSKKQMFTSNNYASSSRKSKKTNKTTPNNPTNFSWSLSLILLHFTGIFRRNSGQSLAVYPGDSKGREGSYSLLQLLAIK